VIVRIKWSTKSAKRRGRHSRRVRPGPNLVLAAVLLATGIPKRTVADVAPVQVPRKTTPVPMRRDTSTEWLTAFMRERDFVQPYYAREILQSAAYNHIPPSLLVCIEFLESSGGKMYNQSTANPFGWDNGKAAFPSRLAAITYVSAQLGSGRYYAGKSIEAKLRVYNPRPGYARRIMDCMKDVKATP
jgi:hypothetical protein